MRFRVVGICVTLLVHTWHGRRFRDRESAIQSLRSRSKAQTPPAAFATVRRRTKGPDSRAAGLAMAFKLIHAAKDHRRMLSAPHLVALVRTGARFERGVLVGPPEAAAA